MWLLKKKENKQDNLYPIHQEWDSFPSPYYEFDKKFFFSGRREFVDKLSHWIKDSNGGSVLVSGVRGVGKTAFVYYSIYSSLYISNLNKFFGWLGQRFKWSGYLFRLVGKVLRWFLLIFWSLILRHQGISVVLINAATLSVGDKPNENKLRYGLLKQIVSGFIFSSGLSMKVRGKFWDLYTSFLGLRILKEVKRKFLGVFLLLRTIARLGFVIYVFAFLFLWKFLPQTISANEIPLTITFGVSILLSIWGGYSIDEEELVKIDKNNFDYIYVKLSQILREGGLDFVFVIDEIDKLEIKEDGINRINNIIRDLKNLFTVSTARFIFISSESYSNSLFKEPNVKGDNFPITSTYFNWLIFLPAVSPQDIKDFLKDISKGEMPQDELEKFVYYIYAETGAVFSKIKDLIRDFIVYEGGKPFLDLSKNKLGEKEIRIARLGKLFANVIQQNREIQLSRERSNEFRFQTLHGIFKETITTNTTLNKSIAAWCEEYGQRGYTDLDDPEKNIARNSLRDLLTDIKNFANPSSGPLNINLAANDNDPFEFSFGLAQVAADFNEIPPERNQYTTTQNNFRTQYKEIADILEEYYKNMGFTSTDEVLLLLGEGKPSVFASAKAIYDTMSPGVYMSPADTQNRLKEITLLKEELERRLDLISLYLRSKIESIETLSDKKIDSLLKGVDTALKARLKNHTIGLQKGNKRYLLVTDVDSIPRRMIPETAKRRIKITVISNENTEERLIRYGLDGRLINTIKVDEKMKGINDLLERVKRL